MYIICFSISIYQPFNHSSIPGNVYCMHFNRSSFRWYFRILTQAQMSTLHCVVWDMNPDSNASYFYCLQFICVLIFFSPFAPPSFMFHIDKKFHSDYNFDLINLRLRSKSFQGRGFFSLSFFPSSAWASDASSQQLNERQSREAKA